MKRQYFTLFLTGLAILSCSKSLETGETYKEGQLVSFKASQEARYSSDTKTSIDDNTIYWTPGDEINIFFGDNSAKFTSQNSQKSEVATFTGYIPAVIGGSEGYSEVNTVMGLYPYDENATCANGSITTTLSAKQTAADNTFADGTFPTIARTCITNYSLAFYNICGGLKFTVGTEGIKKVVITGNNNEKIAGKIKVQFNSDGTPEVTEITEGKTAIVLSSDDGLTVGCTYYIAVLPTVFTNGITIRLETDNKYSEKVYTSKEIKRAVWGNLGQVDCGLDWEYFYEIHYTSTDGQIVTPNDPNAFGGAQIVSNVYKHDEGVIGFDQEITSVGKSAFTGCQTLLSIDIPNSVEIIGQSAFSECKSLKNVIMPNSLDRIEGNAFNGCPALEKADIPSSVTYIGTNVFSFTKLTSIKIPASVTKIEFNPFPLNKNLISITVDTNNKNFNDGDGSNCIVDNSGVLVSGCNTTVIPQNVKEIGSGAFCGTDITTISIPNSVKVIRSGAFSSCENLTSINIPTSITFLYNQVFSDCSKLSSIVIPSSVVYIGQCAFERTGLTSITIPSSVNDISWSILSGCTKLSSIKVDAENTRYNDGNGSNCIIETATNKLIQGCDVTVIPQSVVSIGVMAFDGFQMTEIDLPKSLTSIEDAAFYLCEQLNTVHLPKTINTIGTYAFSPCSNLQTVFCEALVPPTIGSVPFPAASQGTIIYVPNESVDAYRVSWSEYANQITGYDFE